jgi:hypothetical protein
MKAIKSAMEEGFNAFIAEHKTTPSTRVTLVQFDSAATPTTMTVSHTNISNWHAWQQQPTYHYPLDLQTVYANRPVTEVPTFTLNPRGGTPLIDALALTIDATGKRLRELPDADRPAGVLFVVITDGEENTSHLFKRQDVFNKITHQRDTYDWQFVFLGANQDAIQEGQSYGIPFAQSVNYNANQASTRAMFTNTASKSSQFVRGVAQGMPVTASAQSLNYNTQEREEILKGETPTTPAK